MKFLTDFSKKLSFNLFISNNCKLAAMVYFGTANLLLTTLESIKTDKTKVKTKHLTTTGNSGLKIEFD